MDLTLHAWAVMAQAVPDQVPATLWAGLIAIILALLALFKDVLTQAFGGRKPEKPPTDKPDPLALIISQLTQALTENAQSNGRLADVLERMETANEKAMDKIGRQMEEQARVQQGIDYRTKEILKLLERAHGD